MKKLIKLYWLISLFTLTGNAIAQQDPILTQYMINPALYNPAYVSQYEMTSLTAQSRVQWLGNPSYSFTNVFSGSASFSKMGYGVNIINDRVGLGSGSPAYNNTEVDLMYSYKIQLGDLTYISAGLQTGIVNKRVNNDGLNVKTTEDPLFPVGNYGGTKLNFGTGVYLMNEEKYFLGLSIPRLINSTYKDGEIIAHQYNRHYYISGGAVIGSNGNIPVRPSFLVRTTKGTTAVDLSTSVLLSEIIWIGATLRNFDGMAIIGQLDITDYFRIGYSMDLPFSNAIFKNLATHELSINVNFAGFKDQVVPKPRFF